MLLSLSLTWGSLGLAQEPELSPRAVVPFDTDWAFNYFPDAAAPLEMTAPEYDDGTWLAITTPHTWSTYETTGDVHPFILAASERMDPYWWKGWGVYRKSFLVGQELDEKLVFIEFDGVQKYCEVYLNGTFLGEHKGGYTAFSFELSELLHRDGQTPNVLTVLVSNRRDDLQGGIPPMTAGNFNVYGGIYRKVRLVITSPIHIPFQGSARHEGGTFWQTPLVSEKRATVTLQTWVRNAGEAAAQAEVRVTIADADGREVARTSRAVELPVEVTTQVSLPATAVMSPRLWRPDDPAMYTIRTEVWEGEELRDVWRAPLGFRTFRWDYETNTLYWNGEATKIGGTNRHQEYPWIGDAMPDWMHERDLRDIRLNLNHNFLRTAHYPQDPYVYDLTDQLGLITVAEVPNIKSISFSQEVQKDNLVEMIRSLRNHPSIFMWSVGNETSDAADSAWALEEDPARLIHQRKSEGFGDYVDHNHENLDMESLLRVTVRGWYTDDVKDYEPENSPEVPKSGQVAGTEEWQHLQARIQDSSIRGLINAQGVAWLYADHGADRIYRNSPLKNVNAKGWVDLYREPKYIYYLWQANWGAAPMVHVRPFYWQEEFVGEGHSFQVDSNGDEVELLVNGRSLGRQAVNVANFQTVSYDDVVVERGALTGIAYKDGVEVARHEVAMPGEPAAIALTVSHQTAPADRAGLVEVRATVVDKDGLRVLGARPDLHWEIDGPGSWVGPKEWHTDFDKNLEESGFWYIDTPVANLVRTTSESGPIRVRVSAAGLAPGEAMIEATSAPAVSFPGISVVPLANEGRQPVPRHEGFQQSLTIIEYLSPVSGNQSFAGPDGAQLRDALREWVLGRHAPPVPESLILDALIESLYRMVMRSGGELIGDDFNHLALLYNDLSSLEHFAALLPWHPDYRREWMRFLSEQTFEERHPLDVSQWEQLFREIPSEGRFVVLSYLSSPGEPVRHQYRNTQFLHRVESPSLEAAIAYFEPSWAELPEETRKQALRYLEAINPSLKSGPSAGQGGTDKWRIWIPSLDSWIEAAGDYRTGREARK